ncbi:hypothetical protein FACS1894127_7570 [Clostridia bacterium]|nr:hypothetical protein FACS1894127_7570 [Clostridia bacterium]
MEITVKIVYKNDKLHELRKNASLSQSQLANLTGISVRVLQEYEQGNRNLNGAKLVTLLKFCNALKCKLSDILTDPPTLEELSLYGDK